jgi:hypothetical protein
VVGAVICAAAIIATVIVARRRERFTNRNVNPS